MDYTRFILMVFLCAFAKAGISQETTSTTTPAVELIEEKQPKRWLLYAQNNTDVEHEAFLMVQGEGFRRSADRPTIKRVPPKSKVLMMTLIPLKGVTPNYTKIFTFEEDLQVMEKRKGEDKEAYINIRPLDNDELTIFIEENCEKCDFLINFLNSKHLKYRVLDVNKNHKVKEFMFDHLRTAEYKGGMIDLPVVMFEGRKHWSIVDIQKFIGTYDWSGLRKSEN